MHKPSSDYFNVKDVRGSSPAASLAADLSQNFRLDNDHRFVASDASIAFRGAPSDITSALCSPRQEEHSSPATFWEAWRVVVCSLLSEEPENRP